MRPVSFAGARCRGPAECPRHRGGAARSPVPITRYSSVEQSSHEPGPLVIKLGSTLLPLAERKGDFEDWIIRGMGMARDAVVVVILPAERHSPIPPRSLALCSPARTQWSPTTSPGRAHGRMAARRCGSGRSVLGICYGQSFSRTARRRGDDNPLGHEMGTVTTHLTSNAAIDPLLGGLGPTLRSTPATRRPCCGCLVARPSSRPARWIGTWRFSLGGSAGRPVSPRVRAESTCLHRGRGSRASCESVTRSRCWRPARWARGQHHPLTVCCSGSGTAAMTPEAGKRSSTSAPHPWAADIKVLLLLGSAVALLFWPLWLLAYRFPIGGGDLWGQLHPVWSYVSEWLRRGIVPLWSTRLMAGDPIISEPQYGLVNPLNWPLFLAHPIPSWLVSLRGAASLWLAGSGLYLLLRRSPVWGLNRGPAAVSAILYMASDPFISHLGHPQFNDVMAWLPWACGGLTAPSATGAPYRSQRWLLRCCGCPTRPGRPYATCLIAAYALGKGLEGDRRGASRRLGRVAVIS